MNRRTFIQVTGLGLTGRFGFAEHGQPIAVLLKLLEDSPRERVVRELVRMIRTDLRYEDLLAAFVPGCRAQCPAVPRGWIQISFGVG